MQLLIDDGLAIGQPSQPAERLRHAVVVPDARLEPIEKRPVPGGERARVLAEAHLGIELAPAAIGRGQAPATKASPRYEAN